jgi:NADH-quinone oxidoreductase subunit K
MLLFIFGDVYNIFNKKKMLNQNFIIFFILFIFIYLFSFIGAFLRNKDYLIILIFLEIIFLTLNLIFLLISLLYDDLFGFIFTLFLIGLIAGESAIGLALIISFYRFNFKLLRSDIVRIKG